jgi:hypothetical protein
MSNNDLIQDVENAMREERTAQMWREYGPYIIGGALLAVILTAGISGWRTWNNHVNQKNTAVLMTALQDKDEVAALRKADGQLRPAQQMIARMTVAGQLLKDGKKEEALKAYQSVADDTSIPGLYRDLALWLSVRLDWSLRGASLKDKADVWKMIDKLQPVIADNSNPWNAQARIEAAEIAAHGLKDVAKAREYLAPVLSSPAATDSEKQRTQALDHVYSLEQPAEKAGDSTGGKSVGKEDQSG